MGVTQNCRCRPGELGCVKSPSFNLRVEHLSQFHAYGKPIPLVTSARRWQLRKQFCASLAHATFHTAWKAGTHMWTAPWLQEFVRVNPIACDHMSGLLSRSHMTAAKMGSATRGPNNQTASFANGSHGLSRVLGSIDHTHLLEQA